MAQANPARAVTITRGLARIKQTAGTVIAYSTQPGAVAADGEGRNSPFAAAFIQQVGKPGVEIGPLSAASPPMSTRRPTSGNCLK